MDDGMRVPVNSALFERGKSFPKVRVQDLPNLHLLEGRAMAAHASEHGTELILGLSFPELEPEMASALADCIHLRDLLHRGGGGPRSDAPVAPAVVRNAARPGAWEDAAPTAADEAVPAAGAGVQTLLLRRSTRTVLVMSPGPARQALELLLRQQGFQRLECVDGLDRLPALFVPGQRRALPGLVLADLALARSGDDEPLAAARIIERCLAELGGPATVVLCEEVDPTLLLAHDSRTRFLPHPDAAGSWTAVLDGLLG
jgi:hypothetical protein